MLRLFEQLQRGVRGNRSDDIKKDSANFQLKKAVTPNGCEEHMLRSYAERGIIFFTTRHQSVDQDALSQLTPHGVLRVGINLGNFLLVSGRDPFGSPQGVAPDLAREIAVCLDAPLEYVLFSSPRELADAAESSVWDICLIGAEPTRAQSILFTSAYVEIDATYLVPSGSRLRSIEEVDQSGVRIAVAAGSAYDLWLTRHIQHAELIRTDTLDASYACFVEQKLEVLAGLKPRLLSDAKELPGARVLDGRFTAIQQAIGTPRCNEAGAAFLCAFVEEAKASGLIARLIKRHDVRGLSIAPSSTTHKP
ncbi:ABC transporter substrate-binding protein [Paraburkholderia sediminicola]|uniref:ABC transporter substrate-binding protein n=1 Tax=Paraburkholderia sediminicola TaxID=458836 RepID=UPI0038BC404B